MSRWTLPGDPWWDRLPKVKISARFRVGDVALFDGKRCTILGVLQGARLPTVGVLFDGEAEPDEVDGRDLQALPVCDV